MNVMTKGNGDYRLMFRSPAIRCCAVLLLFIFLIPVTAQLSENAPADNPLHLNSTDEMPEFYDKIPLLTAHARKTWPGAKERFLKNRSTMLFVSLTLVDNVNRQETVFVQVKSIAMNIISGYIASDVNLVSGYKRGDELRVKESRIVDWTISLPDGTEDGNLIGKYIDSMRATNAKAQK